MTEEFETHLSLRTPVIWVTTDELDEPMLRTIAHPVTSARPIFRLDGLQGLLGYDTKAKRWKQVPVPIRGGFGPTYDPTTAMAWAVEKKGVMLVDHAHLTMKDFLGIYDSVIRSWREAVRTDVAKHIPATFILISHSSDIPPELARHIPHVHIGLPGSDEVQNQLQYLLRATKTREPAAETMTAAVRSGLGCSSSELTTIALRTLRDTKGRLEPTLINSRKLELIRAGGILDIRPPNYTIDEVGGLDRAKHMLELATWMWNNPVKCAERGMVPLRRILLIGVSGSGKSMLAEAAASALGLELGRFGISSAMNKFVGESEANIRRAFSQVRAMAPLCLWIDEMGRELSGGESSGVVDAGTTSRVHGTFLTGLQELPPNVFLMCAANRIDDLAPEMLRADRFDKIMFVGFPTFGERVEIFRTHLGERADNYNLELLAKRTPYFTGAEIKSLVAEVNFWKGVKADPPTTEEICEYAPKLKGRIWRNYREQVTHMYKRALAEWDWASSEQEAGAEKLIAQAEDQAKPTERQFFSEAKN